MTSSGPGGEYNDEDGISGSFAVQGAKDLASMDKAPYTLHQSVGILSRII